MAFVVAAATAFALLPDDIINGATPSSNPVEGPRLTHALEQPGAKNGYARISLFDQARETLPPNGKLVDVLVLDADRDGRLVLFRHERHKELNGGEESCRLCHHMNRPLDRATSCHICHSDMFSPVDTFEHNFHVRKMGGNDACIQCHTDPGEVKSRLTAVSCLECHDQMARDGSIIGSVDSPVLDRAPGYMDAMHGLCIRCHEEQGKGDGAGAKPPLARCEACHDEMEPELMRELGPKKHVERKEE